MYVNPDLHLMFKLFAIAKTQQFVKEKRKERQIYCKEEAIEKRKEKERKKVRRTKEGENRYLKLTSIHKSNI